MLQTPNSEQNLRFTANFNCVHLLFAATNRKHCHWIADTIIQPLESHQMDV